MGAAYLHDIGTAQPNSPPQTADDAYAVGPYMSEAFSVLDNDEDMEGDPMTIVSVTQPAHGRASHNASAAVYMPDMSFVGTDAFSYTVSDGRGETSTAAVSVTVTTAPEHDPTLLCKLSVTGTVGQAFAYDLFARGLNPIGYQVSGLPAGLSFDGAHSIGGIPVSPGTTAVTLTATNPAGTDTQTLTLTILGAPLAPTISSIGADQGVFRLAFDSTAGGLYDVMYKDDLTDTNDWQPLTNGWPGTGGILEYRDTMSAAQRFYRVRATLP
jgi:hypothetical protein